MDDLMTTADLAALTHCSVATVYQWNHHKTGPKRIRAGKKLLYRRADVEAWLADREVVG